MADIAGILGGSLRSKVLGVSKTQKVARENPNSLLKIVGKNFMSLPGLARDLNVARQNIQKLVKLEGGKPATGQDAQYLKEGERAAKLDVEIDRESKKPTPITKSENKLENLKKQFSESNIVKKLTKYLSIAAIVGIAFVAFKDTFAQWSKTLWSAISEKMNEFVGKIKEWFNESIQPIVDRVKEFIQPLVDAVSNFVSKIGKWFEEKISWFAQEFPRTFEFIKNIIDKVYNMINGLRNIGEKIGLFKKKEKIGPVDDSSERQKLQRQQNEALKRQADELERQETERVRKLEKEKQYTGDDEIVRARLGLPPKTETMRREAEAKKQGRPIDVAPPPESIIVPGPFPSIFGGERKKTPTPSAPSAPSGAPGVSKPTAEPAEIPGGTPGLIVGALNDAGITSPKAHANVLATVKAESNFKVQSENLNYSSADRIKSIFGARRIPSVDFAQQFVKNPEGLANYVYKTTDGNSAPGDGFKYRGRGFIQHTGKNQYAAISKATGTDLLSNPDALNSPEVAAKAIPWFFLGYKKLKPEDMDNMSKVNKAVGFAGGAEYAAKREASAQQIYANMQSGSGTQMASVSSEVSSAQRQQMKPQTPMIVNAPTTNNRVINNSQTVTNCKHDTGSELATMRV